MYTITDLGPAEGTQGFACSTNARGDVAIMMNTGIDLPRAYFWRDDAVQDLGTLGGSIAHPYAINASGWAVGFSINSKWEAHAFLWGKRAGMQDLGTLGGTTSIAYGINTKGSVVGYSTKKNGTARAFLWHGRGKMKDLGTLGGAVSIAYGINDREWVVGYSSTAKNTLRAFVWRGTEPMRDLGTLGGANSIAYAINAGGWVAGVADRSKAGSHAFLWRRGKLIDLGVPKGGYSSCARAVNSDGWVVGEYVNTAKTKTRAFVYDGKLMKDLNTLVPRKSGWLLEYAYGINDVGYVVGTGRLNGKTHAYLLKPPHKGTPSVR